MTTNYESVLEMITALSSAESAEFRDVAWTTNCRVVGVARDHEGRVELFLVGPELKPASSFVADTIEFRSWHRDAVQSFDANRLVFPSVGHFDQVAAFICTELLRAGADASLAFAFAKTEPLIELAIERLRLTEQAIVGLAGELFFLDALCRRGSDAQVSQIVASWNGWQRSLRDFSWGSTGIEVKTTTRATSSHLVEGIHQVEVSDGPDSSRPESQLLLASIGLQTAEPGGNAFTIPQLVSRIVERMEEAGSDDSAVGSFLSHVAEYGASSGSGYVHETDTLDPAYATSFLSSFFRVYKMADAAIEVLRRQDVVVRPHVDASSLSFRVNLPTAVSADNPIVGANKAAQVILGAET